MDMGLLYIRRRNVVKKVGPPLPPSGLAATETKNPKGGSSKYSCANLVGDKKDVRKDNICWLISMLGAGRALIVG